MRCKQHTVLLAVRSLYGIAGRLATNEPGISNQ